MKRSIVSRYTAESIHVGYNHRGRIFVDAKDYERLEEKLEMANAALNRVLRRAGLSTGQCDVCGYHGSGYYQPETHACAATIGSKQDDEPVTLALKRPPSPQAVQAMHNAKEYQRGYADGVAHANEESDQDLFYRYVCAAESRNVGGRYMADEIIERAKRLFNLSRSTWNEEYSKWKEEQKGSNQ